MTAPADDQLHVLVDRAPTIHRGPSSAPPNQRLTLSEAAILQLIATGHTNARIAEALGITESTVVQRLKAVYSKFGVHDRAHALYRAIATGQLTAVRPADAPSSTR